MGVLAGALGMAVGGTAQGSAAKKVPVPPWVVLASFGPDAEGWTTELVRVLDDDPDSGTWKRMLADAQHLDEMHPPPLTGHWEPSSAVHSQMMEMNHVTRSWASSVPVIVFATRRRRDETSYFNSVFLVIENTDVAVDSLWVTMLSFARAHLFEIYNEGNHQLYAIILWTLLDLLRLDPDTDMAPEVQLSTGIPMQVAPGTIDRIRRSQPYTDLSHRLANWKRIASADAPREHSKPPLQGLFGLVGEVLDQLHSATEGQLSLDRTPERTYLNLQDASIVWELVFGQRESVELGLWARDPETGTPAQPGWWLNPMSTSMQSFLSEDEDLLDALRRGGLIIEADKWEAWYNENVASILVGPTVELDIDTEPYVLLDAQIPYLWETSRFIAFLQQENLL